MESYIVNVTMKTIKLKVKANSLDEAKATAVKSIYKDIANLNSIEIDSIFVIEENLHNQFGEGLN